MLNDLLGFCRVDRRLTACNVSSTRSWPPNTPWLFSVCTLSNCIVAARVCAKRVPTGVLPQISTDQVTLSVTPTLSPSTPLASWQHVYMSLDKRAVWCAPPNVPRSGGIQPTKNTDLQLRLGVQAPPGIVAAHPANTEGGCWSADGLLPTYFLRLGDSKSQKHLAVIKFGRDNSK